LIRGERPDIVHTTLLEVTLLARVANIGMGIPLLTSLVNTPYATNRGHDPNVQRGRLRVVQAVDGITARHLGGHFHAITGAVKDAAVASLGIAPPRITVVHRGRDPERLGQPSPARREAARAALGLGGADIVLAVGRQEYLKGHVHLLRAAPGVLS